MPRPEIALPVGTLLIGDLHLDPAEPAACRRFVSWLGALRLPRLVILGDLFETWIGPAQVEWPGWREIVVALSAATAGGVALDLVPGNRDFLLDPGFARLTGVRLHERGFVGRLETPELGGDAGDPARRVLVIHGDELCTLDRPYQRMRRVLRSAPARWLATQLPGALSGAVARRLRARSRSAVAAKRPEDMAQQPFDARRLAAAAGCAWLVCGHVHKARDEVLADGPRWLVVDAFGGARDAVRVGRGGLELGSSRA